MDGSPVGIQRWDENQPDSSKFDENCVTMTYYTGEQSKQIKQSINPR